MPRLRDEYHRRGREDETPDWAWAADEDMPTDKELQRQALVQGWQRAHGEPPPGAHPRPLALSAFQVQALACASHGLTEGPSAELLGVTRASVQSALLEARHKLAAKNTTQAVAIAIREGIIG